MTTTTRTSGPAELLELERIAADPFVVDGAHRTRSIVAVLEAAERLDVRALRRARTLLGRVARRRADAALTELAASVAEQLRVRQRELEWQAGAAEAAAEAELLRNRAVEALRAGPMRPSVLAEHLGVSDAEVVRALRPLRDAGQVEVRAEPPQGEVRDGRARWYWLVPSEPEDVAADDVRDLLERYRATGCVVLEEDGKRFRLPATTVEVLLAGKDPVGGRAR